MVAPNSIRLANKAALPRTAEPPIPVFIGGVTTNTIESVFAASDRMSNRLALMFTDHQMNPDGGYVCNLEELISKTDFLQASYPNSEIVLARDHFSPVNLSDRAIDKFRDLISRYTEAGFSFFHFDFAPFLTDYNRSMSCLEQIVQFTRNLNPNVKIELSTTPDNNISYLNLAEKHFSQIADIGPEYIVIPTGSLVKDRTQVGSFYGKQIKCLASRYHENGIFVKEHNADFLTSSDILKRTGLIDSFNVAPEFGMMESLLILNDFKKTPLNIDKLLNLSFKSEKWKSWTLSNSLSNEMRAEISMHYHFKSDEFLDLVSLSSNTKKTKEDIISMHMQCIHRYL